MVEAHSKKLVRLPFDQYSRQKIAHDAIDQLRKGGQSFTILDVGGYKGATAQFQSKDSVTVLDLFDVNEKNYVKGDATNMTFADGAFDFVVSFDVLEHVPLDLRKRFLRECSRVASRGVIVASPINTQCNEDAERHLNELYKNLHGKDHIWLKEHIDNVIPEPDFTNKELKKMNWRVISFPSNYTPFWLQAQSVIFAASKFDVYGSQIEDFYELYNTKLQHDGVEDISCNYRLVTIATKTKSDEEKIRSHKERSGSQLDILESSTILSKSIGAIFASGSDKLFGQLQLAKDEAGKLRNGLKEADLKLSQSILEKKEINDAYNDVLSSKSFKLSQYITRMARPFRSLIRK